MEQKRLSGSEGGGYERQKQISFGTLLPIILPKLDKVRAIQLDSLYTQLRRNEISKGGFIGHMKNIVGDHMLRLALLKLQSKAQAQNPPVSHGTISVQGLANPQQQQHLQFSQSSGATTYQPYAMPHDPQMRQVVGTINPMNYVKQEPSEQSSDKQPTKPPVFLNHGPTYSSSVQVEQRKCPATANHEMSATQNSPLVTATHGTTLTTISSQMAQAQAQNPPQQQQQQHHKSPNPYPVISAGPLRGMQSTPMTATGTHGTISTTISSQIDTHAQVGSQSALGGPTSGIGGASKTSIKKPISGQKKRLDALASSPPLPSKKQKVSGSFADQSIEHLNDVTAVSGVNLREEEEQLFSLPKNDYRVSEASRKAVLEEEDRLILQKLPLKKKLAEIMTRYGLKNLSNDVERCISLCVEERLRALIGSLIRISKQRADSEKSKHNTVVTSDVRKQIMMINQKAREEVEKKQAEADKLRKQNEQPESSAALDLGKEKEDRRGKSTKVNKDEDDKRLTTAANVAARAAVGGDDMLSKWQLMAQARQKRDEGSETGTSSQVGGDVNTKVTATSTGSARDTRGHPRTPGSMRQVGRSQMNTLPPRVAPSISLKDVIAVLEREPQMAKSTIFYRLYDKLHAADTTTE